MPLERLTVDRSPYIVGEYKEFAFASLPAGWFECNFQQLSRTAYSILFSRIGTTYGSGNGTTTFNVPDCRGRVKVGRGQLPGGSNRNLGDKWGTEAEILAVAQLPFHNHNIAHSHSITGSANNAGINTHAGIATENYNTYSPLGGYNAYAWQAPHVGHSHTVTGNTNSQSANTSADTGSGQSHNNCQPSFGVIIAIYAG
jgi:microcystin-dependent protein